jgi:integrase
MRLTDLGLRSLPVPPKGQKTYFDVTLKGFGCRVSQGGTRTFVVMVGRQRKLITVGRYPAMSLSDARQRAKVIVGQQVSNTGQNTPSLTLREALDVFYKATEPRVRPKTLYDYQRSLNRHLAPLLAKNLSDLTTDGVMRIIDGLHQTPIEQLHAFLIATTFFRFCVRRRFLIRHPLHGLQLPGKFNERDRVLSPAELKAVYQAATVEPYPFGVIVLLCILSGQRRGEIAKLRWEYIDRAAQTITLPKTITKNGLAHTFPYGTLTQAILDKLPKTNGYLFPGRAYRRSLADDPQRHFEGWSRAKENFDKRCAVESWTLHDLRRTFRTLHGQIGTPPHIAERLVNHVSITSPVSKIYDRYTYLPEMREAVVKYQQHLLGLGIG